MNEKFQAELDFVDQQVATIINHFLNVAQGGAFGEPTKEQAERCAELIGCIGEPGAPKQKFYTKAKMAAAFGLVHNPDDWKAPIDAVVPESEVDITLAAITFFTATTATIEVIPCDTKNVRIKSIGYRQGPAGDH